MAKTLAHGYSSQSTQRELSNEYQHDRVWMVFKSFCIFLPWSEVASAWKGLNLIDVEILQGIYALYSLTALLDFYEEEFPIDNSISNISQRVLCMVSQITLRYSVCMHA